MDMDDEDDDGDDDDSNSDFEDVDDSDKSDSDGSDSDDSEQNAEEKKTIDDNSLGLQTDKKTDDESDDNDVESDDEAAGSAFDIVVTMDCLVTPVKKSDHVKAFKDALKALSVAMPEELKPILSQLGTDQRTMVTELLKAQ